MLEVLNAEGQLALLHGDTLIDVTPELEADAYLVSPTKDHYDWGFVKRSSENVFLKADSDAGSDPSEVICGFFLVSDASDFRGCCAIAPDFLQALNSYGTKRQVALPEPYKWFDLGHLNTYYKARVTC